ncbi:MAG: hypothetical protein A2087_07620 [Spirochaetes bacterium GWD1_61_31]|nr:MAG: hypothetical protein A2Y37_07850 [Spirochaetes bacterium GWB1_60_80]OHD34274.1 MAG: hypothetical protein A2004_12900 [Spirochaetes bacterium GWC1_61_12]OHD40202.1 MAG: hypothetical protein A2087_07620 [Spirochaetes bacterium GWD1_61_31]OHD45750.1 MAG: hypothetical protein A2Y35_03485 [Spirochaetes bacterium GWE1_60_18]HAX37336.1 hypothetical protein [Spirochaetaceae bacterium]
MSLGQFTGRQKSGKISHQLTGFCFYTRRTGITFMAIATSANFLVCLTENFNLYHVLLIHSVWYDTDY